VTCDEVLGAAFLLRDFLAERSLKTVVKTSEGKGLHIVLHLKRKHPWETMKVFGKAVAGEVARFNPLKFTIMSSKSRRTGKIYIDWMRNGRGATCIAPWGVRARPGATVSMPLNWAQIPELAKSGYTIHMPPENPEEWVDPKPHSITAKLLRDLGVE